MTKPEGRGPLAGIRILDMTTVMLGPYATQMLGDYGADVVKIESPGGDSTRATGPALEAGMAAAFIGSNRSKRSIVLDLKQAEAREALMVLADTADVLIYSMRPQKMAALGLAPAVLRARTPRLVVVAVHGFAEGGPYAGRPAYDDIIQGLSGLASLNEMQGGEPSYLPTVIADKACALYATQAVLIALVARAAQGEGSYVEVPMLESMVNFTLVEHFYGQHFRPPLGEAGYSRLLTKWRRPYPTTDGYVCIVPYSDQHWHRFFAEAGQPEFMQDDRFRTMAARTRHIDALYAELARCVAGQSTSYWLAACHRLDIPAAPYNRLADLERDPQLQQTGYFTSMQDPAMGTLVTPAAPLKFDGAAARHMLPPRLGQHTSEVLQEAGFSASDVQRLLERGAAQQFKSPETTH
ncbi:MAG: L-carnitine dehydratase/bile acid-inducible protein [Variovorax sp.]|nr:L-carnitine dehydratase/bile acid-inducible protein [Variovorax sp.]